MRSTECGNPDEVDRGQGYHRGWGGWGRPVMVRLYIRESQKVTEYGTPAKRRWVPVGLICPMCRWTLIDAIASEEEATA